MCDRCCMCCFFSPTFLCLFIMVVVKVDFPISGIEAEKYLTILKMYSYTPQALEMKLIDLIPTIYLELCYHFQHLICVVPNFYQLGLN